MRSRAQLNELVRSRTRIDALLLLAALVVMMVSAVSGRDLDRWGWVVALSVLVSWLPLTMLNRYPLPVLAWVIVTDTVHIGFAAHAGSATLPAATMLALFTIASNRSTRVAWTAGAAAGLTQALAASLIRFDFGDVLLYLNWSFVAVAMGRLINERRRRIAAAEHRAIEAERTKQVEVERQVTAERMRIARELHDVLAHHITVVNAQAGVAQYLLKTDPSAAEAALEGITANTRAALDELRATLGLLRDAGDHHTEPRAPLPTSADLDALLDSFREAGLTIALSRRGEPRELSSSADLAFYRVTQESLTNATKHAPGADVSINVTWSDTSVTTTIANTAPRTARPNAESVGTGHGVLGMRERATVAGGTLDIGPTSDGGFSVELSLPTTPKSATSSTNTQKAPVL